ncbi:MAG: SAM-dependent chlorinase/fluorinase [Candidatus Magasanikbacteria bacterium]|nr:SAM-dependent chlorinase/fluorinase [Candidatus Magasanikbacteria bacterium]
MNRPFITLTSDFGVQSQGVGIMEAVARQISPEAHVIHLMHGLPDFSITPAARTLETIFSIPVGFHVCVVDPGVGTQRRGLIIKMARGDFLIGPDNGVLMAAARILGGAVAAFSIENPKYMRQPVSPVFHGRDVFTPAAAHLANGVALKEFGPEVPVESLVPAPYEEATIVDGEIQAEVIQINKYGSLHLNITNTAWDSFGAALGAKIQLKISGQKIGLTHVTTFGEVPPGTALVLKDDYGRVEVAINLGNFSQEFSIKVGDLCALLI